MNTQTVLRAFLARPEGELNGLDIAAQTDLLPGTTYPILLRLEGAGGVTSRWETLDPGDEQRPRCRYYKLTLRGIERAGQSHGKANVNVRGARFPRFRRSSAG